MKGCTHHPKIKPMPGTLICRTCAAYDKARHERLKRKGMCPSHQHSKAVPGRTICKKCIIAKRLSTLRRQGVSEKEIRKAQRAWEKFDGECQCCGSRHTGPKGWCLDHSHKTKKFRGIICTYCNLCLGHAQDSLRRLKAITRYIRRSK
jgi:hypothetical protein